VKILCVHDTPLRSGFGYETVGKVMAAYGVEHEIVNVAPQMEDKALKKLTPEFWLPEGQRILTMAKKFDKILCMGGLAGNAVHQTEKAVPLTQVRGRSYLAPSGHHTLSTYQPKTFIGDTDFFRDFCFDVDKLVTKDGPIPQPEIEIVMVERKADLKLLRELHGASFLACDIEATSLSPYDAQMLGIGFAALNEDDSGYVVVIPQKYIGDEVFKFIRTFKGTLVFHNLMYDLMLLWKQWGRFERDVPQDYADTMLMHWLLDERPFGRYKSHGLDRLQRLFFDAPPKSVNMKDWLEEYFREDVGEEARTEWMLEFCDKHPETARTEWRKFHLEVYGKEANWRGRKVGRDIFLDDPDLYSALLVYRLPKALQPAPDKARKAEMWDEMMRYMGEDCYYTARLYPILKEQMLEESERLWVAHTQFDIPAAKALTNMRLTGAPINLPYLREMKVGIESHLAEEMLTIRALVQEHTAHPQGSDFNPNSSKQVAEVLYDKTIGLGLQQPQGVGRYAYKRQDDDVTTNSDTLKVLARIVAKKRPAIAKLINQILRYRVRSKIVGTYIDGILDRVDPDGRVRGEINLHGTATARVSSSNPNLQNIPDASHVEYDIRKAYVPTPGWVLLDADYSQLELRVAALFSQDQVMIDAYKAGADIHQEVALLLWNKPKDQISKYERYLAKCMNFGVIYGRGARSIATGPEMDNLVEMSGRSWSNSEIDTYFAKFKVGYGDLFKWMELVKKDSMKKQFVENPIGHRRRFDLVLPKDRGHVERQTVNTPIQGFAARMTIHALVQMDKHFDPEKQRVLFTVHDSIMVECLNDPDTVRETAQLIKHIMENALPQNVIMSLPAPEHSPFDQGDPIIYNLPFVADVEAGLNWGECKYDPWDEDDLARLTQDRSADAAQASAAAKL
jgi:DNA polymerase I-like protein with 3'-5' exonuclease and polymerase domains